MRKLIPWEIRGMLATTSTVPRRILAYLRFVSDFISFRSHRSDRFSIKWSDRYPCIADRTAHTSFDAHYIYHPAWAARILAQTMPSGHIDLSSTLTFCSIVSAFIPIHFYDYRPADIRINNLTTGAADLVNLPFETGSIQSLSCMHVLEHIGLGRYGDPIDPDGDIKAINELKRVLAPGGTLLIVIPIGQPKIMYNAHRVYSYEQVTKAFSGFILKDFSLVTDPTPDTLAQFISPANQELADQQEYGCGCFYFTSPES